MKTLYLTKVCGTEVLSRANVRKLYDFVNDETETIDMTGVTFISRSVADELCNIEDKFPNVKFVGVSQDVETMQNLVRKGRSTKRDHTSKAKVSITFNCKTMDDLRTALQNFG